MMRIGVVAGLEPEIRALRKLPAQFVVAASGMGAERAYAAAKRLVDAGAGALVSWGSAAALDARLVAGTLLIPDAIATREAYPVDGEWQRAIVGVLPPRHRVHTGPLAEAAHVLATAGDKRALAARSGAAAADMESAGIARAARESGVPFIAIRAVADVADVAVPPQLARIVGADGGLDVAFGVARLVLSPWHWAAAVRLGLGFNAALLALRAAAPALYACAPAAGRSAGVRRQAREPGIACVVRA